jgi:hypothetical protein
MATGTIGEYFWAEFSNEKPELVISDVVRQLSTFLYDTVAVNVSWDSGRMRPSVERLAESWLWSNGVAVSPRLDEKLTEHWPRSGCGFDEWYFFRSLPASLELEAFFNWTNASIKDWHSLAFKFDLAEQIRRSQPEVVLGEGNRIFVIAQDPKVTTAFERLAHEREA